MTDASLEDTEDLTDCVIDRSRRCKTQPQNGSSARHPLTIGDEEYEDDSDASREVCEKGDFDYMPHKSTTKKAHKPRTPAFKKLSLQDLQQKYEEVMQENVEQKKTSTELREKRATDRKSWADERERRIALQNQLRDALNENDTLREKIAEQDANFRTALRNQREQFAKAETDLLQRIKKEDFVFMTDDLIRERFQAILARCRQWAKDWHSEMLTDDAVALLTKQLLKYVTEEESINVQPLQQKITTMGSTATRILVYATLSRTVLMTIFRQPFRFLSDLTNSDVEEYSFVHIFEKYSADDVRKALMWRAQTFQYLHNHIHDQNSDVAAEHNDLEVACAQYAQQHVSRFEDSFLRSTSPAESSKRSRELKQIFIHCASLGLKLWSQKSIIEIHGKKEFCGVAFTIKSALFEPHGSMGLDSDDVHNIFENTKVQIVLTPAIVARGSADGDRLDETKVWSKAVVLNFEELLTKTESERIESKTSKKQVRRKSHTYALHEANPAKRLKIEDTSTKLSHATRAAKGAEKDTTATHTIEDDSGQEKQVNKPIVSKSMMPRENKSANQPENLLQAPYTGRQEVARGSSTKAVHTLNKLDTSKASQQNLSAPEQQSKNLSTIKKEETIENSTDESETSESSTDVVATIPTIKQEEEEEHKDPS